MNQNLTYIIFIIDRSGSMDHLTDDTIGGFNSFIDQQRKETGEAKITVILFDDEYEVLYNGIDLKDIPKLTREQYFARGSTALLDSVGKTIVNTGKQLSDMSEEDRPGKVIIVTQTDGQENASREYTNDKINEMVTHQQDVYNWKFIFTGANIDSFATGASMGVKSVFTANYSATSVGTTALFSSISRGVSSIRNSADGNIDENWAEDIK